MEGSVGLKNVLGHAERLEAAAAIGNERSNTYHLSLTQPRFRYVWSALSRTSASRARRGMGGASDDVIHIPC